jgi:CHASE2 domain-containing sensor protein
LLGVGSGALALALVAYGTNVMRPLELQTVDERFSIRGTERHADDPIVVAIDDRTFGDFENKIQWPFPRSYHGRVIDQILRDRPRVIVYDIQFTEPTLEAEDNALIDATARARGRIVLATTEVDEKGNSNVFGGGDILRQIGARAGNAVFQSDPSGVIRRVSYASDGLKSCLSLPPSSPVGGRCRPRRSGVTGPGSTTPGRLGRCGPSPSHRSGAVGRRAACSATRSSSSGRRRRAFRTSTPPPPPAAT